MAADIRRLVFAWSVATAGVMAALAQAGCAISPNSPVNVRIETHYSHVGVSQKSRISS